MTSEAAPDANSLLSRPTLDLTDAEALIIVEDLRKRRAFFQLNNKKGADKPKAAKTPTDAAAKKQQQKAATDDLLASLNFQLPGASK